MGEAKRKREAHAQRSFGQGLLLPDPVVHGSGGRFSVRDIDLNQYNSAILYWDKIACPANNLLYASLPHEDLLVKEGILLRPDAIISGRFGSNDFKELIEEARLLNINQLERETPGYWALSGGEIKDIEGMNSLVAGRTYLVELCGALPLPPISTQIEDILHFKQKRKDELGSLQNKLREMYLKISESTDKDFSTSHQLREIDLACRDTIKVTKEWWKLAQMSDLKSIMPIGSAIGASLGLAIAMPTTGALLGAAGGLIKIGLRIGKKRKEQRKLPFWYAAQVSKEFE